MKSVALDSGLGQIARQGERLGEFGLNPVECRVETRDLDDLRCMLSDRTDGLQVMRLVQGCQRDQRCKPLDDGGIDEDRAGVICTAMNDPVPDRQNGFTIQQLSCGFDDRARGLRMTDLLFPCLLRCHGSIGRGDPKLRRVAQCLHLAAEQGTIGAPDFVQAELDAGRAGIQDGDTSLHRFGFPDQATMFVPPST